MTGQFDDDAELVKNSFRATVCLFILLFSNARETVLQVWQKGSENFAAERDQHHCHQLYWKLYYIYGPCTSGAYITVVHLFDYAGSVFSFIICKIL